MKSNATFLIYCVANFYLKVFSKSVPENVFRKNCCSKLQRKTKIGVYRGFPDQWGRGGSIAQFCPQAGFQLQGFQRKVITRIPSPNPPRGFGNSPTSYFSLHFHYKFFPKFRSCGFEDPILYEKSISIAF